jgi:hypothetical protein
MKSEFITGVVWTFSMFVEALLPVGLVAMVVYIAFTIKDTLL